MGNHRDRVPKGEESRNQGTVEFALCSGNDVSSIFNEECGTRPGYSPMRNFHQRDGDAWVTRRTNVATQDLLLSPVSQNFVVPEKTTVLSPCTSHTFICLHVSATQEPSSWCIAIKLDSDFKIFRSFRSILTKLIVANLLHIVFTSNAALLMKTCCITNSGCHIGQVSTLLTVCEAFISQVILSSYFKPYIRKFTCFFMPWEQEANVHVKVELFHEESSILCATFCRSSKMGNLVVQECQTMSIFPCFPDLFLG